VDGRLSREDAVVLLGGFVALMAWTIHQGMRGQGDHLMQELEEEIPQRMMSLSAAWLWLAVGLVVLVASSRLLVWGAVTMARGFGVSDLMIGLTIVAVGTSLPELLSSIIAARKGEHDMALGNVIGSNLFNTLAVVGIAGTIHPFTVDAAIVNRDMTVMAALTVSLFVIGFSIRAGSRRINRFEGGALLATFCVYSSYLVSNHLVTGGTN
jgi:cation:H+ antiporter